MLTEIHVNNDVDVNIDGLNWLDYIYERFQKEDLFKIQPVEMENINVVKINSSNRNNETNIRFFFNKEDDSLVDVRFNSGSIYVFSSHAPIDFEGFECNLRNITILEEEVLNYALLTGWIEVEYYFIHVHPIKSRQYFKNKNGDWQSVMYYGIIWPVLYLISLFGWLCKKEIKEVQPILDDNQQSSFRKYGF